MKIPEGAQDDTSKTPWFVLALSTANMMLVLGMPGMVLTSLEEAARAA